VGLVQLTLSQLQQRYNREWHVIAQHDGLARLYEQFIEWDMQQARPFQIHPEELPGPDLAVSADAGLEAALAAKTYKEFPPATFTFTRTKPVRVQPLMTPDNYIDYVTPLIRNARRSIWFQNQYIKPTVEAAAAFRRAVADLRKKQKSKVDVRIILRNEGDIRTMLEALRYEGFDMKKVRLQAGCHNKGIIIDSEVAVIGSHNWSSAGITRNRDASLAIYNAGVAQYFEKVFQYDWETLAHQRIATEAAPPQLATDPLTGMIVPWSDYYED
jgi:phosphatidylserine/phosphatidylglycerophosphate/cardiolipin synthase-like enzyme